MLLCHEKRSNQCGRKIMHTKWITYGPKGLRLPYPFSSSMCVFCSCFKHENEHNKKNKGHTSEMLGTTTVEAKKSGALSARAGAGTGTVGSTHGGVGNSDVSALDLVVLKMNMGNCYSMFAILPETT